MSSYRPFLLLLSLLLLATAPPAHSRDTEEPSEIEIGRWLTLGPAPLPLPLFAEATPGVDDEEDVDEAGDPADEGGEDGGEDGEDGEDDGEPIEATVTVADLLGAHDLGDDALDAAGPWPAAGDTVTWIGGRELTWSAENGPVRLSAGSGDGPEVAYLAAYVETDRYLEASLTVRSGHLLEVWLDGESVAEKTSADKAAGEEDGDGEGEDAQSDGDGEGDGDGEPGSATAKLELWTGKHLLLVKTVRDPEGPADWTVSATLEPAEDRRAEVALSTDPRRGITLHDMLDVDEVTSIDVSPDGRWVALGYQNPVVPAEHRESWIEVWDLRSLQRSRVFRGSPEADSFAWGPSGRYTYVTRGEGGATLWLGDFGTNEVRSLLEGVENLGGTMFSPDGHYVLFSVARSHEADEVEKAGVVRLRSLQDRWAGFRDVEELHLVTVEGGLRRQLTAGDRSVSLLDVSADGSRLLLLRTRYITERPFTLGEVFELDLTRGRLTADPVASVPWINDAQYSPDGERILISGGPSAFGETGLAVPEGMIANEYEGELYLVDRDGGAVEALTRGFDPAVDQVLWTRSGALLARVTEGEYSYVYRLTDDGFSRLPGDFETVNAMDAAEDGSVLVYVGSSATVPPALRVVSLTGGGAAGRALATADPDPFGQVEFGRVEDYAFTTGDGTEIPGRVYYPPDHDAGKRYPVLVYYYGGVVPTERSFGGRYPKNWWAANGYLVYVLQPSGAVGFGQERAARHVNDWGKVAAAEVIQGVRSFLADHPSADPDRIGCFGGSYGGFLSMLLPTETDLFAACISHAGISSISSYWGEGWWGYLYSSVAAADSYPWSRPDVFVDQSPLFRADKIDTPLLLLHGTADPNVPPGESDQMFAALTLLGKEVEYVRFTDEAHWILTYPKRILWWQTIIAWFDKHLKDQPEGWQALYPE
jgi:dipeptidyl aminopeptidase/acylaminoacyl peptidase